MFIFGIISYTNPFFFVFLKFAKFYLFESCSYSRGRLRKKLIDTSGFPQSSTNFTPSRQVTMPVRIMQTTTKTTIVRFHILFDQYFKIFFFKNSYSVFCLIFMLYCLLIFFFVLSILFFAYFSVHFLPSVCINSCSILCTFNNCVIQYLCLIT